MWRKQKGRRWVAGELGNFIQIRDALADCGAAILFRFLLAASIKELSTHRLRFCSEIRQTRAGRERGREGGSLYHRFCIKTTTTTLTSLTGERHPGQAATEMKGYECHNRGEKIRPHAGPAASRNRTTLYMFLAANVSLLRIYDLHANAVWSE